MFKISQNTLLWIIGILTLLWGALSLLPWNCDFARFIYSVGDLPARCDVNVD